MATKSKTSHHSSRKLKKKGFSRRQLSAFILVFAFVGGIVIYFTFAASLPPPSVYLSPSSGNVNNGDTLTVDVYEDSGTDPVNVAQVNLAYSTSQLSYVSFTNSAAWPNAAQSPSGDTGSLKFARFQTPCGPSCGSVTGANLVVTVTFKVVGTSGTADINFDTGTTLVRSDNNQNESPLAMGNASFTIASAPSGDTTPPSAPADLKANAASPYSISLSWTASTDNVGVAHYDIYRNSSKVSSTTTTSFTDTALPASTSYTYQVSAVDAAGNQSALSNSASATTNAVSSGGGGGGTSGGTITRSSGGTSHPSSTSTPVTAPTNNTTQPPVTSPTTGVETNSNPVSPVAQSKLQLKPLLLGTLGAIALAAAGFGILQLSNWLSAHSLSNRHLFASGAGGGPAPIILNPGVTTPPPTAQPSPTVSKPAAAASPPVEQVVRGSAGNMIKPNSGSK